MINDSHKTRLLYYRQQLDVVDIGLASEFMMDTFKNEFYEVYNTAKATLDILLKNDATIYLALDTIEIIEFIYRDYLKFLYNILDEYKKTISEEQRSLKFELEFFTKRDTIGFLHETVFDLDKKLNAETNDNERFKLITSFIKRMSNIFDIQSLKKNSLNDTLNDSQRLYRSLERQVEDLRSTNSEILESAKLVTQSAMFNDAAKRNSKEANFWIAMIFVSVGIFIWLIFHLMNNFCFDMACYMPEDLKKYNAVCDTCGKSVLWLEMSKSIIFRLLLISFNLYVVTFCVKNYNAAMHNKTINRHRNNSFAVAFHLFNNTTSKNKDEILSKAADSIFQYQKTGYYGKDNQPISPNVIQSIFDKFSSEK